MKIAIDLGHNVPRVDTGAVGVKREDDLILSVGKRLIETLKSDGHLVIETCPDYAKSIGHSLSQRVQKANKLKADQFISIHFNAANFRAHGAEVYAFSSSGRRIAQPIQNQIVKLGFYNRGVKHGNFYVLKYTNMPAALVECCFCDSQKDMRLFDAEKMANAIAVGIIGRIPTKQNMNRKLIISVNTLLKKSTAQSRLLPSDQKRIIKKGTYKISSYEKAGSNHLAIQLDNGESWFIYASHAEIV